MDRFSYNLAEKGVRIACLEEEGEVAIVGLVAAGRGEGWVDFEQPTEIFTTLVEL